MRFASKSALAAQSSALKKESYDSAATIRRQNFAGIDDTPPQEDEEWVTTYMDIITLLLILFVVLLANADFSGSPAEREELRRANAILHVLGIDLQTTTDDELLSIGNNLNSEFSAAGLGDMVDISSSPGSLNIRLNDQILFRSGEAEFIGNSADKVMEPIVDMLNQSDYNISVEGHTDSVPINTPKFPSNWELSSARATFVVRYLISEGVASERLRAIGYAQSQPIADNASAEGRSQNRRVTLVLTVPDAAGVKDE
ncbi:flagellar motor protein MotB [Aliidiomarina shirensis]|uniref:Flagellar motor protein MotB n=1 Tax=Aliidiomarina shirensis TaxID=1048642 RepID=A0A432WQF4_9GAMM|nr:OmpA family protein [Aliidiomarina shirensis]RUO36000.1 flagellar motor protein MotB [Aliidiomarina shirensis]